MDQHALMWHEATRDLEAEQHHAALAYALADLDGVRDFTHLASGPKEYAHRVALTADRVHRVATIHRIPTQDVQEAMDASFRHLLAARLAAAPKPPAQDPAPAQEPPPGAPADFATEPATTAKTSKPHTLPHGGQPASPPPAAAPAPAVPQVMAARAEAIAADIRAMNPHLPAGTVARLTARAMRHLAAEPLAYNNWNDVGDGPWTKKIKQGPGKQKNNQNDNQSDNPDGDGDGAGGGEGAGGGGGAGAAADIAGAVEEAAPLLATATAR